jgi:hypothetical protein
LSPTDEEQVIYRGRTFVRARRPGNSWASWNNNFGGGPVLVVRAGSFEVSAPQGMILESRDLIIQSSDATMWLDKVGWAGTPIDRKECIRVAGRDQKGRRVELALTPVDGLQQAWQAFLNAGVIPRDGTLENRGGEPHGGA